MTLDSKYGVPTVAIHTNTFEQVVQSVTRQRHARGALQVVPQPVMGKTAEQLRAYVDGKSPISGPAGHAGSHRRAHTPRGGEMAQGIEFERSTPRLVETDTEENLHRLFLDNQLDRQAADRSAHRGARGGHAGRTRATSPTRSRGTCAPPLSASTGSLPSRKSRSTR